MANRFKKMIQPLLDEARRKGYKAGYEDGMNDGFRKKTLAYENEIKFLKVLVERLRAKPIVPGPEMADPNIMELCFHNGERHMKEKILDKLKDIAVDIWFEEHASGEMTVVTFEEVIQILEGL